MYDEIIDNYHETNDKEEVVSKALTIWTQHEADKLHDLIQFIDEFINTEEYEDYLKKKRNINKKNVSTQYCKDDYVDIPSDDVEVPVEYPLTSNSKKMAAFIRQFEAYLLNKKNRDIVKRQLKGINIIRKKIEEVKNITALTIESIKRAKAKKLDEETKEFCELFSIDFSKVREQNKKNIKEKVASYSKMLRTRYLTRKENIANIARTILEEIRRDKKILERLNKSYDYKVTKNEWIVKDMEVVGTAMSIYKQESEKEVVEEPVEVEMEEVIEDVIEPPKKAKIAKDKKKKKEKKEKNEKKKVESSDKKSKKSKKSKTKISIDVVTTEKNSAQPQSMTELVEQFQDLDEIMENQHMFKQSPEDSYPIDPNFSCQPQTLIYDNYEKGKVYRRRFKIRNNSFLPRKFRFLKLVTPNDYDTLLFQLIPLIGIQKLVGGASLPMLLKFTPIPENDEITAKLIFLSLDEKTQSYQKFHVHVQCTTKRPNLQISSNHIYFGKIPIWQTTRCVKRLAFSNDGLEPCEIYIRKINDPLDLEEDEITIGSSNPSVNDFNEDTENQNVIRSITSEIMENVFANFHFTHTFIKLDAAETKAINILMKNIDYFGNYIEKYLVEAYDQFSNIFFTNEVITEAYVSGPFISVFPETLDYGICTINSVYQLPMDIKNSSTATQAVTIKVPSSMRDYVKPDVVNIYIPPQSVRSVMIRLLLGKSVMSTFYFNQEMSLLELSLQVCILTKNYNEVPPVVVTTFAIITSPNLLNISPVDDLNVSYMADCLVLDVGCCTIYETVYSEIQVENGSLIPQIYGFMDLPAWITIEPNYGFTEILPGNKQIFRLLIHPQYQDLLKNFNKKKNKDFCLTTTFRIESVYSTSTPNTFFDVKKFRKSIQFTLKEMAKPINPQLKEDIYTCVELIKKTYFNSETDKETEEYSTIFSEEPTKISMFLNEDVTEEENEYSNDEENKVNVTQVMIKVNVIKPLVEVSFQQIELPDTPCGSYSVISVDIRALRMEFSQESLFLRKKDLKLPNYEAWFKITGDNKEIRVEPSCGILKNGDIRKIFFIATPTTPDYIIQETARSIKYSEIYEMKKQEFELSKLKKTRKTDTKKKGKRDKGAKKKDKSKNKKDKKKKVKNTTSYTTTEDTVESNITVSETEININYEDYFPSEMCYWRSMKPYYISSNLTCVVTYSSDSFVRPKEVINMIARCRVIRPDFISNLKLQRIDFGNVSMGMSGTKNIIIQNIKYNTIKITTSLLNPVGPFSIPFMKNPKVPSECYLNVPIKFTPKTDQFAEEYIEITSGTTVLPLILQGFGVEVNVTFSPNFLVCRFDKATATSIEECLIKIQNFGEATVEILFEKVFEIEGVVKSVPVVKNEQEKPKRNIGGGDDKASTKSKGSKKSKESKKSKDKADKGKRFSDELTSSEIYSIPNFAPIKNSSHFEILNVENNAITLQPNTIGTVRIGFGMKDILDRTKIKLKEKVKKEKTKKDKAIKRDKSSMKSNSTKEEKLTYVINEVVIRPMIGIIEDFFIISTRFKATRNLKKLEETWTVIIDGQEDKPIPLIVKGYAEVPSIEIGNNNELCLPTAQVDTVVSETFKLKNTCHFNLRFTFYPVDHKFISIIPTAGDALIEEEVPITVIYHADVCAPKIIEMCCKLHVKQKLDAIVGPEHEHDFTVHCDRAFSELCATQISDEFTMVEYGSTIQTDFNLFNFGLSTVSFVLHTSRPVYNEDKIVLIPESGDIAPGSNMKINIEIEFISMGENEIKIEYFHKNSTKTSSEITHLLKLVYATVIGSVKIAEIVEHNFGALFAKTHFWDYLKIERLNEIFMELQPNQADAIEMYLPECLLGSQHYVTLLIKNTSLFDTTVKLKRKKMCMCEIKQSQSTLNTTKLVYDCPHRELLLVECTSDTVKVNYTEMITIKVDYRLPGETIMAYEIHLSHNRVIFLYFHIFGILPNTGRISAYNPDFTMLFKSVHLATRVPPIQVFWLYNNSELPMEIEVDTKKVSSFCRQENYPVFECSTERGEVKPFSIFALNFKFCPIEIKKYKMNLPIRINGEEIVLKLEGFGTLKAAIQEEYFQFSMPQACEARDKFPAVFSADYIMFKTLPIWNRIEKIIFIENITTNKVMHYEWSSVNIYRFVTITAIEKTGYLLPGQSHAVTIKVESCYESLLADFVLTCQLTDLQQLYTLKKIEDLQNLQVKEKENALEFLSQVQVGKERRKSKNIKETKNIDTKQDQIFADPVDPVTYLMALTVRVNILHRKDVDISTNLQYYPVELIETSISCYSKKNERFPDAWVNNEMQIKITEYILNRVISDVVFGNTFEALVDAMKEETHMYYKQFALDSKADELLSLSLSKRIREFFSRPPLTVLSETLKTFIVDSFPNTFDISTALREGESSKESGEEQDKEHAINSIIEHLAEMCKDDCTCKEK